MAFVSPIYKPGSLFLPPLNVSRLKTASKKYVRAQLSARRTPVVMVASEEARKTEPDLDWDNLGFQYMDTECILQMVWKDGEWGPLIKTSDAYVRMHVAATALHYGQSCFEGLKAFRGADDVIRIFRPDENAKRMAESAERLLMPIVPEDMFLDAVHATVHANARYVPPYGTGGSLYIRPLLFGSGARIGLQPADEYTFLVLVVPVGDYYRGGLSPVSAIVVEDYDRAAPKGVGHVKVAGNYAADLKSNVSSKMAGFTANLYLDAVNRRTIEEFGTSNFIGIMGNTYVTPDSPSVLRSVTNKTLMQLARDDGMTIEQRPVDIEEVRDMDEVAACGTAVVITAVTRLSYKGEVITIGKNPNVVGPRSLELYKKVRALQYGEIDDPYGWTQPLRMS